MNQWRVIRKTTTVSRGRWRKNVRVHVYSSTRHETTDGKITTTLRCLLSCPALKRASRRSRVARQCRRETPIHTSRILSTLPVIRQKKTPFYMTSVIIIDRCNQVNHVLLKKYVFLHVSNRRKKMRHLHNTCVHYVVFNNLTYKSLHLTFIHSIKEGCTTKKNVEYSKAFESIYIIILRCLQ